MTDQPHSKDQTPDPGHLADLAEALLDAAKAAGADEADSIAAHGEATSITIRDGRLEEAEHADGIQIGLRVLLGGRQAVVSASETSRETMAEMVERALAMAREAPVDDMLGLADPEQLARFDTDAITGLALLDPSPAPTPSDLENQALAAEAAARLPGISQVEAASASHSQSGIWRAASNGFSAGYRRSGHGLSVVAITGQDTGMERDYAGESRIFAADMPRPEDIGTLAAERTLARRDPRRPPTGAVPVLFDERVAASLIGHLLGAINGNAITRGASWLLDALDEPVLPDGLSLTEDPFRPRYPASRLFDAEGLPTQRRAIVDAGRLTGWVLDLASARKLGLPPTGNAMRGVGGPVSAGVSNVVLDSGTASRKDLIATMGRGLVVTSFLGASINPTTGDYSRGVSGFWVENGQIAHPVNECTIAGNLRDFLRRITPANDARPFRGIEVPSLLVEGLVVAGS